MFVLLVAWCFSLIWLLFALILFCCLNCFDTIRLFWFSFAWFEYGFYCWWMLLLLRMVVGGFAFVFFLFGFIDVMIICFCLFVLFCLLMV